MPTQTAYTHPFAEPNVYITQLAERLKNPAVFEKAISPLQFSVVMFQVFMVMGLTVGAFSLLPALWCAIQGQLMLSENYNTRFNAMMGGGLTAFLGALALLCWTITRVNKKPLLRKLYQLYMQNPQAHEMTAVLRRDNIVLCAFAAEPLQQKMIESLLENAWQIAPEISGNAYSLMIHVRVKYKAEKANQLKKQLIKTNPALEPYKFHLDWFELAKEQGDKTYFLFFCF